MATNELDYINWISLICTLQSMETFIALVRARNKKWVPVFTFKKFLDGMRSGEGLRKYHEISQGKIKLGMLSTWLSVYLILQF